jgi:hypothetical protein
MAPAAGTQPSAVDPDATSIALGTVVMVAMLDRGAIATNGETNPRMAPWRMHCGSY